jgi:hypothetical protein
MRAEAKTVAVSLFITLFPFGERNRRLHYTKEHVLELDHRQAELDRFVTSFAGIFSNVLFPSQSGA